MAATVKTQSEIALLREGGRRLAHILDVLTRVIKPGAAADDLDKKAEELIHIAGGIPSFRGYQESRDVSPYPATICVSVNDEVVHTPPRKETIFKEGDVVSLDIGMWWPAGAISNLQLPITDKNGKQSEIISQKSESALATDMAVTIGVGNIDANAARLILVTKEALDRAIAIVRAHIQIGDIGHTIQSFVEAHGFGIVRTLAGHGVGYAVHEEPLIPNVGERGAGAHLKEGMVIAIEPIITEGSPDVSLQKDGWTIKTSDGKRAAHFEHTIVVTREGVEVLTTL